MAELPPSVCTRVRRLTRQAQEANDSATADQYRNQRSQLLDEYDFAARIRDDEDGQTLVCYPQEWLENGTVRRTNIDDLDRAVELPLAGPGNPDDWAAIDEHNQEIAEAIEEEHGSVHGANAAALAEFASNHYAKPIEALTDSELTEFTDDYYLRNVWSTDQQEEILEESVRLTRTFAERFD